MASEQRFVCKNLPGQTAFGALVTGLDIESVDHLPTRQALRDLWIERGVIVFRGLAADEDMHIRLSEVFGSLEEHPLTKGNPAPGVHPKLAQIRYVPGTGDVYEVDGQLRGAWLPWHSDLVYVDHINRGGILRPIRLPASGGRTGFIDQIAAYDMLPASLRDAIADLSVVYRLELNATKNKFGKLPERCVHLSENGMAVQKRFTGRPRAVHPMVYKQAETGRRVLNVSPWFAAGISGMENAAGDALLAETIAAFLKPELAYFHEWQEGDMVLWDNWRMLHCAEGVPPDEARHMVRTTIAGDYALGRLETAGEIPAELRISV